jgi:hypothetical protein
MDWFQIAATALSSGVVVTVLNLSVDYLRKKKIERKEARYSASLLSHHLLDYAQKCLFSVKSANEANREVDIEERLQRCQLRREGAQFIRLDAFPSGIDFSSIDLNMVEDAWWLHHLLSGTERHAQYTAEFDDIEGSSITMGVNECGNEAFQLARRIRNKYRLRMDKYEYMQNSL